jgi:fatty-acyl-CoA synthase
MVYPSEGFEPLAVLQAVQEEKCTALYGVMAGSPCPVEVMKRVVKLMNMRDVEICYGMTETSPVSTQTRLDSPFDKRVGTVGVIHPHLEIKIIDPDTGKVVPIAIPGELCTRGYSVMLGYWNNPEATAIDNARWMHTGDLATMDQEG